MQICKKNFSLVLLTVIFSSFIFGQSIEMPSMPEMPEMPSISFDGSFYTPSVPTSMMGANQKNQKKKTDDKTVIKNSDDNDILYKALTKDDSTLTASDISTLYDSGLFTDLASLAGGVTGSIGGVAGNYVEKTSTNMILQQILKELNELKQEQKKATPEEKNELSNVQKDSANFKQRNPSVLRFRINDYDIKDSLVEVFLSEPEGDGTFLLTGDRRYVANGKSRTETFYLLFKAEKDGGSVINYKVIPTIVQDYENKNSFVYKLAQKNDLKADKTGNLVVLRYNSKGLNIDLLLDIDKR